MTEIITNIAEVPGSLRHAHEEGNVIFFCGAGISIPAKLPSFKGLVEKLCLRFGGASTSVRDAIKAKKFDTAIGLLENEIAGGKDAVREAVAEILTSTKINSKSKSQSIHAHKHLLTLGMNRDQKLRLITTNYDLLFEKAIAAKNPNLKTCQAPLLPVPKQRWDALVYLHGLLPPDSSTQGLDDLVLNSADFGLAYLTERWAARFLSELFRNFSVCFVGYGINDPILRYILDALAADRASGELVQDAFIFAECSAEKVKAEKTATEWQNKNVTPILYKKHSNHYYLYQILHDWAEAYSDGSDAKIKSIDTYAQAGPSSPFAVPEVSWALTDSRAAKHFSEMDPAPPLLWLDEFFRDRFVYKDLPRFGVTPERHKDSSLLFSMLRRPAPYANSRMRLIGAKKIHEDWDDTMWALAHWLTRHLDDPKLIMWISANGGQVHGAFAYLIHARIAEIKRLENESNMEAPGQTRDDMPQAILRPAMHKLWKIVLAGRLQPSTTDLPVFDWVDMVKHTGITPYLRAQLRKILSPCITVGPPFSSLFDTPESTDDPDSINQLVYWSLVLAGDDADHLFFADSKEFNLKQYLPELLPDLTALLRDALDLLRELGAASEDADISNLDQPSIADHEQNVMSHARWTALILLVRDAWLEIAKQDRRKARVVAINWWEEKYPLFKRLAFFAAAELFAAPRFLSDAQEKIRISPGMALQWLRFAKRKWLWSDYTRCEMFHLLRHLGPWLSEKQQAGLENAILSGPILKGGFPPEEELEVSEYMIWLRLSKMQAFGIRLRRATLKRLEEIQHRHPDWQLRDDDLDELSYYIESGSGADFRDFVRVPRDLGKLTEWIKKYPERNIAVRDDWGSVCQENLEVAFSALTELASKQNVWIAFRWGEALHAWSEDKFIKKSWVAIHPFLLDAPEHAILKLRPEIGLWLRSAAKIIEENEAEEEKFLSLCRRFLQVFGEEESEISNSTDFLTQAINHPIGRITDALFDWWGRKQPLKKGQGLPSTMRQIFTYLCNTPFAQYYHARTVIASRTTALYYADEEWTKHHLLPLFNWRQSQENAKRVWGGFLWHSHFYAPLMADMKAAILETTDYYEQLGTRKDGYATLIAHIGLNAGGGFSESELREVNEKLPAEALLRIAFTLYYALKRAKDRGEYWKNRIRPYLQKYWPMYLKEGDTQKVSAHLAKICIAVGEEHFSEAFKIVASWLQPLDHSYRVLTDLQEKKMCKKLPEESLAFLDKIIGDNFYSRANFARELQSCLNDIKRADPDLENDPRFKRLKRIAFR